MPQPVFYQTLNMVGIDPTIFYANLYSAGGSVLPEYPAPPFLPGTLAFGSDGSQFIFLQASTSISLTDFVVITAYASSGSATANPFTANSITNTNASSSLAIGLASTGLVLKQSVSFIPSGAMFWGCTKGTFLPATTSANSTSSGLATSATGAGTLLYTTSTAGMLNTGAAATGVAAAFAGFQVITSVSTSTTQAPFGLGQYGATSTGATFGPIVSMNNVHLVGQTTSLVGGNLTVWWV